MRYSSWHRIRLDPECKGTNKSRRGLWTNNQTSGMEDRKANAGGDIFCPGRNRQSDTQCALRVTRKVRWKRMVRAYGEVFFNVIN